MIIFIFIFDKSIKNRRKQIKHIYMRMHKERFMLDFRKKKSTKIIKQYFVEDD